MNDSLAIARYWRGRWADANAENVNTRLSLVDARRALVVEREVARRALVVEHEVARREREGTQALREQLDLAVATGKRLMQERDKLREQRDAINRYACQLEDERSKMREERDTAGEACALELRVAQGNLRYVAALAQTALLAWGLDREYGDVAQILSNIKSITGQPS